MAPEIRKLEGRDVEQVYGLGTKVREFSAVDARFWPKDTLERFAEDGLSFVVDDSRIVGFLLAAYQPVTRKLTWENMYLEKNYRGQGLAEKCFNLCWEEAQKRGAIFIDYVAPSETVLSIKMGEKLGFKSAGNYNWMLKFK